MALPALLYPFPMQDMASSRCRVPCRWETDPGRKADADVLLYTPIFDPRSGQPRKSRKGQVVALLNAEAIFV